MSLYTWEQKKAFQSMTDAQKLEYIADELLRFTPGGSEFYDEPLTCIEYLADRLHRYDENGKRLRKQVAALKGGAK